LLFNLLSLPGTAQFFEDDFSAGNLDAWQGQDSLFAVANGELQLVDPNPESSNATYLVAEAKTSIGDSTVWKILVRQEFAPSSSNFARIYLASDRADLTGALNGYYVNIGGISGSEDALELYRQDGQTDNLLLSGRPGEVGSDPSVARLRISRNTEGRWRLEADYSGGTNFQLEGQVLDDTHPQGQFFGLFCTYTSTRSDAFFFDDVRVGPLFVDTEPPVLESAVASSPTRLTAFFNEGLDAASANNPANYSLSTIGNAQSAALDSDHPGRVLLELPGPMQDGETYTLTTTGLADLEDNVSGTQEVSFTFVEVVPADSGSLRISEIMADPSPPLGLPDAEWIELFNASGKTLSLAGVGFSSGGTPRTLPDSLLAPGSYAILCDRDDAPALAAFGRVVAIDGFPALTNGGDAVQLTDAQGSSLLTVIYDQSWYNDPDKSDGGFTLELIDPDRRGNCPGNWSASDDPSGGTPGRANSLLGREVEQSPPQLLGLSSDSPAELRLTFDEPLSESADGQTDQYSLEPGLTIEGAFLQMPELQEVLLLVNPALDTGTTYTLTIRAGLEDCLNNTLPEDQTFRYTIGRTPRPEDLLLTEIMADPTPSVGLPEADFLELYNRSGSVISLRDLGLSAGGTPVPLPDSVLRPGAFLLLCDSEDAAALAAFGWVLALEDFPALTAGGDLIRLTDPVGNPLLEVAYERSWYRDPEKADGGFTLELIDPDARINCPGNWRASRSAGGGTPGRPSSWAGEAADTSLPVLLRAIPQSPSELLLTFDSPLVPSTNGNAGLFRVSPGISVMQAFLQPPARREVLLLLDPELDSLTAYTLGIAAGLESCLGPPTTDAQSLPFGLPRKPAPGELIINEVLFEPQTGGSDFVELRNLSDKLINLERLVIQNTAKETGNTSQLVERPLLVFPGEQAVITGSPQDILDRYFVPRPELLLANALPTLEADTGNVTVYFEGVMIDSFNYSDDYHFPLLSDTRGVSLERISPQAPTQEPGNWHSGASTVGFATPTGENSQFQDPGQALPENLIRIANKRLSPDGDGFEDVLLIDYETAEPGFVANIRILDHQGREVRYLVRNQLLANRGQFQWDGTDSNGEKARIGIYVVWIELFNPEGDVQRSKESIVLAGRF
jgi:hypothetical protein